MKLCNYFLKISALFSMTMAFFIGGSYLVYFANLHGFPFWAGTIIFIYLVSIIFAIILFNQDRNNYAKLSWLVVIIIFPLIGVFVYLFLGMRYTNRITLEKYFQKDNFKYEIFKKNQKNSNVENLFAQQSKLSNRGVYDADFTIHKNGHEGFKSLFRDLSLASKFIHIKYYIVKPGEIWEEFKSLLVKKAQEGVKIRMIIDDFGRWGLSLYDINFLEKNGVEVRILGKIHFPFFVGSNLTYRNHRKLVVIDGNIVHLGGLNIGDEYVNFSKKYGVWIDYQAKITGSLVRSFSLLFLESWNYIGKSSLENFEDYLLEKKGGDSQGVLVEDTPEIDDYLLQGSIINWILQAKKSIKICTPYFVPTPPIFQALKTAALKGVKIQIFIPGKSDNKKAIFIGTKYWANRLAEYGAEIYQAIDIIVHAKLGIFDQKYAYFGSLNIDFRSMYAQFEFAALVKGKVVGQIESLFDYYQTFSKLATTKDLKNNHFFPRLVRGFLIFFAPIM